jgi:hypothetical protein
MATYPLPVHPDRRTNEMQPLVYRAMIGLTIWLVLSVWALFSRGASEDITLSIITLFFVVLVGIPVVLWLTWRRNTDPNEQHENLHLTTNGVPVPSRRGLAASAVGKLLCKSSAYCCSRHWDDDLWSGISVCSAAPELVRVTRERFARTAA